MKKLAGFALALLAATATSAFAQSDTLAKVKQSGKFVTEKILAPATLSSGSAFVPVLSKDPQQQWLYLADGTNHKVWVLRRSTMEVVGEFGRGGRQLGQFLRPHGMSIDSKGNLNTAEVKKDGDRASGLANWTE